MTYRRHTQGVCVEPSRDFSLKLADDFVLAAVGDIVPVKPIAQRRDSGLQSVSALLATADASFGNMEAVIRPADMEFDGHHMWEGPFLTQAPPEVAIDMKRLGFNIMQFCSNRTQDWGVEGQRFSLKALRAAGIAVAGSGENLADARAAAYFESPGGTVGLVSASSALTRLGINGIAAAVHGRSRGRPGLSALRTTQIVRVLPDVFDTLRNLVAKQPYAFPGEFHVSINFRELSATRFVLDGRIYEKAETPGYAYEMSAVDLAEIMQSVRNAKIRSNLVIAALHYHQWAANHSELDVDETSDQLPDMVRAFAREAIANGADVVLCHGPGDVAGIEIIDGKPALYGLGNFIRNPYVQNIVPIDTYLARNRPGREVFDPADLAITDTEVATRVMPVHPRSFFESVLARITFSPAGLKRIEIHPLDLGFDQPIADIGIPRPAGSELAAAILQRIQRQSAIFGTELSIVGEIGVIEPVGRRLSSVA